MKVKNKTLFGILVGILFLVTLGSTYAFFSLVVKGNNNANNTVVTAGILEITYLEMNTITASNISPGWSSENKIVTVTNTGTENATYSLIWDTLVNEFINDELLMSLACTSTGATCSSKDIPVSVSGTTYTYGDNAIIPKTVETYGDNAIIPITNNNINIQTDFNIGVGETQTLTLKFYFKETGSNQNYNQNKVFNGKLRVGEKVVPPFIILDTTKTCIDSLGTTYTIADIITKADEMDLTTLYGVKYNTPSFTYDIEGFPSGEELIEPTFVYGGGGCKNADQKANPPLGGSWKPYCMNTEIKLHSVGYTTGWIDAGQPNMLVSGGDVESLYFLLTNEYIKTKDLFEISMRVSKFPTVPLEEYPQHNYIFANTLSYSDALLVLDELGITSCDIVCLNGNCED